MERRLLIESCLRLDKWGILEMFVLLTEDIVVFEEHQSWDLDVIREQLCPTTEMKLNNKTLQHLLLSLLVD